MTTQLETAFAAIDAANAQDPNLEDGQPAALLYGQRMSAEQAALCPHASDRLKIAARGQHIERWTLPRDTYPQGRAGYLEWRREQGRRHAARVGAIIAEAGYGAEDVAQVEKMLRKEGIKRDTEVQALEDIICFTFIRHYLGGFAQTQETEQLLEIVRKTARKMSPEAREKALATFEMPEAFAAAFA
ncbi:DUF4202 domain-containing protein [Thioclava sp. GXIMD4215]|uniref:DUF4202 domain-containing protein n=1 Tax=Thioclava sp. GXIMD4215 TaxID=3131928 RepID=UPI00324BCEF7